MKIVRALALTAASTLILTAAFIFPASTQHQFDKEIRCSCEAPDGSCSASITCTNGCQQHCGPGGDCYVYCSGVFSSLSREVTLEAENSTYPQLVDKLAGASGVDLEFVPFEPNAVFNSGYKNARLWGALDALSERGTLRVAVQDFQRLKRLRRILLSNEKISFAVRNTSVDTFVADMAALTGRPLRVIGGNPKASVYVELQEVTLGDILDIVSRETGTLIRDESAGHGVR